ncbi:MAG: Rieske (2Fe-2S) protein [Pseudonocardia sp.]|jgi:Rieske Fe-S protein
MHDEAGRPGSDSLTRRGVLVAGAATAALAVAGCTTYTPGSGAAAEAPAETGAPAGGAPDSGGTDAGLGPAADVPVGGGTVFKDRKVVVTQPEAGTFKAFSATCPHQGCSVDEVADGTINCPCHGSKFNVADGSVVEGPARKGLAAKQVSADGGTLRVT